MTLCDFGRIGQLALDGGAGIVPDGWFATATAQHVALAGAGQG